MTRIFNLTLSGVFLDSATGVSRALRYISSSGTIVAKYRMFVMKVVRNKKQHTNNNNENQEKGDKPLKTILVCFG